MQYKKSIEPRCIFALLRNKWVDPSALGNRLMVQLYMNVVTSKFPSVGLLDAVRFSVMSHTAFNPTILLLTRLPDDGLLSTKLIEALPQMQSQNEYVSVCKQSKDVGKLLSLDLSTIEAEDLDVMLIAVASAGNLLAVRYLISHGIATPTAYNNMAVRFASAFGHFQLAEDLAKDPRVNFGTSLEQFIYQVYKPAYMECFKANSGDAVTRNIAGIQFLFDLPGAPEWSSPECKRIKLHFDYAVKENAVAIPRGSDLRVGCRCIQS
jgi:hypothetical protein